MNILHKIRFDARHVKKKDITKFVLYILLVLTDDIYRIGTIYKNSTPDYIAYQWLDYYFGILSLVIAVWGLWTICIEQDKIIWIVTALFGIREIGFYFSKKNNCIDQNAYEIYISLLLGFLMVSIASKVNETIKEKECFFLRAAFLNIFLVYISFVMNLNKIEHRYNAPNMDVEATGTLCGMVFVFCLFHEQIRYNIIYSLLSFIGLILSGSRINLIIAIFIAGIGMTVVGVRKKRINKCFLKIGSAAFLITIIILLIVILLSWIFGVNIISFDKFNIAERMIDTFNLDKMKSDSSVQGRIRSLLVGFKIISEYSLGISGYVTNLQIETRKYGFDTFPHSTFLTYYILLGPIVILFMIWLLKLLVKIYKMDLPCFLMILYLFAFWSLSGGPIVSYKPIFFCCFCIKIAIEKLKENNILKLKSFNV